MNRKQLLIHTLLDPNANEAEKDDCAMDLADFDGNEVIEALSKFANDIDNECIVRASCGASLAEIWIRKQEVNFNFLLQLKDVALTEALALIKHHRPEWYEMYNQSKMNEQFY
ncbi:hypothetical protein LOZ80_12265 [Paenibacillus sp. HWE-109]|uniref:hypothetical protein n=1 Tax=Paenibacillus sp. HWE-109 TaxID=1306526 RepID=UPI001EE11117|nr:hypothetical protein [Paenibacillus sp. HWE-109]UKS29655.1 hypothetical protein LOZ80_12265 [Paenibacillus sp. HWE-109]